MSIHPALLPAPPHDLGRPDTAGQFSVSVSQIKTFRRCQLAWWYEKIRGMKPPETEGQKFGTTLHNLAEHYLNGTLDRPTMEYWVSMEHGAPNAREILGLTTGHIKAARLLMVGLPHLPAPGTVEIEEWIKAPLGPAILIGRIDLHDADQSPLFVGDHKTSKDAKWFLSAAQLAHDDQMLAYAKALALKYDRRTSHAKLAHYQYKTQGLPIAQRTDVTVPWTRVEEQWRSLGNVAARMLDVSRMNDGDNLRVESDPRRANPGACGDYGGCAFQAICSHSPENRTKRSQEAATRALVAPNQKEGKNMGDKAARKAALFGGVATATIPTTQAPVAAAPPPVQAAPPPVVQAPVAPPVVPIVPGVNAPDAAAESHQGSALWNEVAASIRQGFEIMGESGIDASYLDRCMTRHGVPHQFKPEVLSLVPAKIEAGKIIRVGGAPAAAFVPATPVAPPVASPPPVQAAPPPVGSPPPVAPAAPLAQSATEVVDEVKIAAMIVAVQAKLQAIPVISADDLKGTVKESTGFKRAHLKRVVELLQIGHQRGAFVVRQGVSGVEVARLDVAAASPPPVHAAPPPVAAAPPPVVQAAAPPPVVVQTPVAPVGPVLAAALADDQADPDMGASFFGSTVILVDAVVDSADEMAQPLTDGLEDIEAAVEAANPTKGWVYGWTFRDGQKAVASQLLLALRANGLPTGLFAFSTRHPAYDEVIAVLSRAGATIIRGVR